MTICNLVTTLQGCGKVVATRKLPYKTSPGGHIFISYLSLVAITLDIIQHHHYRNVEFNTGKVLLC